VVELADMIAVNKADGDNVERAKAAAADFRGALNILTPASATWPPPVMTYSALTETGIPALWARVLEHKEKLGATGELAERRRAQQVKWMWTMLEERMTARLRSDPVVRAKLKSAEAAVAAGTRAPTLAVEEIAALLGL
jgi:LAO/AO transport system kinase